MRILVGKMKIRSLVKNAALDFIQKRRIVRQNALTALVLRIKPAVKIINVSYVVKRKNDAVTISLKKDVRLV